LCAPITGGYVGEKEASVVRWLQSSLVKQTSKNWGYEKGRTERGKELDMEKDAEECSFFQRHAVDAVATERFTTLELEPSWMIQTY